MSLNLSLLQTVAYERKSTSCLLQYANNNRNQERFNDVSIQSADTSIPANRMVLSCYCSFFEHIFSTGINNQVNDSNVEIPDIYEKSLKVLIEYIYTGQIYIDSDNVFDILAAATYLELDEVKEFCFEFLESCLTPDNCITILITAKQHKNLTLRDKVYKHISDNFETVIKTPAFSNLKNDELFLIVFHLKTRFYVNDQVLCRSLLSWTKQDEETRKRHFHSRLFKFVNVDKLSYCLVRDLLNESLICNISEYFDLLNTRMELLKKEETKILSIGGYQAKTNVKVVFTLDDKTNVVYPDLSISLRFHRTLKVNNFVFCIGGITKNLSKSCRVFRLNLNEPDMEWNEMAQMTCKRFDHGAAVFNDTVVVCGGDDGQNRLSSSEIYDAELNKWTKLSLLKQCRSNNQSVTCGGCLYTMGGYNGEKTLSTMERLDGLDQSWKSVSSMQTPRYRFAAVNCDDAIYAIGGTSDGFTVLKSVEKFDCAADKWIYVSDMNIERWEHTACVMQGKIFVIGGRNAECKLVKEIECYDPSTDKWEIVSRIEDNVFGHSIVVV